jgi:pimeloyl-ACP methyl ester carboxylesterase
MAFMDVAPTGTPNGRVVVLLHGKNFDSSYWSGTVGALTAAGFRVVVPDQIGLNKSSKPDLDYSFDFLAANTARLLDSLNVRDVDVVGHSTGGMLAVRFARTYAERVKRLVLEERGWL